MTTPDAQAPEPIDPATVPTELRREWARRPAAKLASLAGVFSETRDGSVRWRGLSGAKVIAWRKRGSLYVESGTGTVNALTSRPGDLLETWGQLEALVSGLIPAIPRACQAEPCRGDACDGTRLGGGL